MNRKVLFLTALSLILIQPSAARADSNGQGRMSQLDFDRPAEPYPSVTNKDINIILGSEEAKGAASGAKKGDGSVRARLADPSNARTVTADKKEDKTKGPEQHDWIKPEEGTAHFLIPRLRGPLVDGNSSVSITTRTTWTREGASCADVTSTEQLTRKAEALRELMNRFTGSEEFFQRQCTQTCADPELTSTLTGFAVTKVPEGDFKMVETKKKTCQYLIRSNVQPPRWQMLKGERGTCTCLPKKII
jgi:hypothetical protein